jgi:hypothetical protein
MIYSCRECFPWLHPSKSGFIVVEVPDEYTMTNPDKLQRSGYDTTLKDGYRIIFDWNTNQADLVHVSDVTTKDDRGNTHVFDGDRTNVCKLTVINPPRKGIFGW